MFPWDLHTPSPSPEHPSKDPLPFSQRDPLQPRYLFFYQAHGPGWEHKSKTSQESELCSGNKPQWFKKTKLISHSYYTSSAGQQRGSGVTQGLRLTRGFPLALLPWWLRQWESAWKWHTSLALLSLAKPCTHWCLRAQSWPAWQQPQSSVPIGCLCLPGNSTKGSDLYLNFPSNRKLPI